MAGRESLPRWGQGFSLMAAASIFCFMAVGGILALLLMDRQLASHYRQATADNASIIASLIEHELQINAERARFAVSAALRSDEGRSATVPLFEGMTALAGVTVYQRGEPEDGSESAPSWTPLFHWPRPAGDSFHWSEKEFRALERSYPVDLGRVERGELDLTFAMGPHETPVLRLAAPFGKQAMVLELLAEHVQTLLRSARGQFVFAVSRESRLLGASAADHFVSGEDLSALPVLRESLASGEKSGTLQYEEVPGGETQYASFVRTPSFTIVSQVPRSRVAQVIWSCGWALLVVSFAAALFGGIAAGMQISGLAHPPEETEGAHEPAAEIVAESVDEPATAPDTGPRVTPAVLMCAHVRGLDSVTDQLKPKKAKEQLEKFRAEIQAQIQAHGGTLHSWRDGGHEWAWVASWTPESGTESKTGAHAGMTSKTVSTDGHRKDWASPAIDACIELRGVIQGFNQSALGKKWFGKRAKAANTDAVLSLHAGEVTLHGRSVSGAPLDLAARLEALARHIGTDLLISSAVTPHLSDRIALESAISGDDGLPELFELVGIDGASPAQAA